MSDGTGHPYAGRGVGPWGLTPQAQRFAELLAGNPNGVACINQAREELGLPPLTNNRTAQRLSGWLKLNPKVQAYFAYCQDRLAQSYPNKELPEYLKQRGHQGPWPTYATPDQLWDAAEQYFQERKIAHRPIVFTDLCAALRISAHTMNQYEQREGFEEVVRRIRTECAAYWERKMADEPKTSAMAGNYELNRLGFYEKQYEADRVHQLAAQQLVEPSPGLRLPATPEDADRLIAALEEHKKKMLAMVEQAKALPSAFAGTVADATFEEAKPSEDRA